MIRKLGVEIRTNTKVGTDVQLSDLQRDYRAVFIATGAHRGLKLGIEGEDSGRVIDAVEFLRAVNLGQAVEIGDRVAVIGGGDAAVDAARVARRLGKDVKVLYRRTRGEMPAAREEIEELDKEGIELQLLAAPVKVLRRNGGVEGIECVRMKLGDIDQSGRRRPVPIEGSEYRVEIDTLIPAIGQEPDVESLEAGNGDRSAGLTLTRWNTITVDPETMYTGMEGVFAGGDVVTGPSTVVQAMAHGKIAARMIHLYVQGQPVRREYRVTRPAIDVEVTALTEEEIEQLRRPGMPELDVVDRLEDFREVQLGFTSQLAVAEAKRCVRCDREGLAAR
jgi:NADPH-dependent glutamate synthase beta subunit-like oxidoreductase